MITSTRPVVNVHTSVPVVVFSLLSAYGVIALGNIPLQAGLVLIFATITSLAVSQLLTNRESVATQVKRKTGELRRKAYQDSLTGLPNRRCFTEHLERKLSISKYTREKIAILMIDLNLFKQVNDAMGHESGDELLRLSTQRMARCLPETVLFARLGGDEFVVMLTTPGTIDNIQYLVKSIKQEMSRPFNLQAGTVEISASVGSASSGSSCHTVPALLRAADHAMYQDKNQDRPMPVKSRQSRAMGRPDFTTAKCRECIYSPTVVSLAELRR